MLTNVSDAGDDGHNGRPPLCLSIMPSAIATNLQQLSYFFLLFWLAAHDPTRFNKVDKWMFLICHLMGSNRVHVCLHLFLCFFHSHLRSIRLAALGFLNCGMLHSFSLFSVLSGCREHSLSSCSNVCQLVAPQSSSTSPKRNERQFLVLVFLTFPFVIG